MTDLADLTATTLLRCIQAGEISAAEVMEACLDRIAAREPALRAFAHLDADAARRSARAADAAPAGGRLRGLPLAVKDILDVAGMPTGNNSPIWEGWRPRADAACVALARGEGAVMIGKTVTTEFATRQPGPTANPHNPAFTPGGSSSGSAAGVAAGFFPLAFGTQTAGSILRPAAYCGVVGYMPTHGLIHRAGMKVMSEELDTIGAIARSVADCALLVSAVAGIDLGDPERRAGRAPRLLLCLGPAAQMAQPETLALMERAASAARRAGAEVVAREMPPEVAAAHAAHPIVMNGEGSQALAWELANHSEQLSDVLRTRLLEARARPAEVLAAARAAFRTARAAFPAVIEGFDAILTPSTAGEPPEGLGWTGDPAFNSLWTALHLPCVTVPAGTGPRGLPLGAQLVGPHGGDRALLGWAEWLRSVLAEG
ncbi:amidase [Falsiroseomonas oryzae]|uniref:amidase n=1 Tax=Falsiroseomonas oryzae TaxID=2766473 RepID=UPI0022EAB358|nr:amidase [Roseomonas sp. MO-31]